MFALQTAAFTDRINSQPLTFGINLLLLCSLALVTGCYFKTGINSSSDTVQQTLLLAKV